MFGPDTITVSYSKNPDDRGPWPWYSLMLYTTCLLTNPPWSISSVQLIPLILSFTTFVSIEDGKFRSINEILCQELFLCYWKKKTHYPNIYPFSANRVCCEMNLCCARHTAASCSCLPIMFQGFLFRSKIWNKSWKDSYLLIDAVHGKTINMYKFLQNWLWPLKKSKMDLQLEYG